MYSILGEKEYPIQLSNPAINKSKMCLGCSHGWLVLVDDNSDITPISLPPLIFNKITLSIDPITSPSDYVVAAIYMYGYLSFKSSSKSFWIRVDVDEFPFTNVVFYKGLAIDDCDKGRANHFLLGLMVCFTPANRGHLKFGPCNR